MPPSNLGLLENVGWVLGSSRNGAIAQDICLMTGNLVYVACEFITFICRVAKAGRQVGRQTNLEEECRNSYTLVIRTS